MTTAPTAVWQIGPYRIVSAARFDNPAFAKHSIYRKGRYIGSQFSVPILTDCEWLERDGNYAEPSEHSKSPYGYTRMLKKKRASRV